MKKIDNYYHVEDDLKAYPDAWCFVIWSKRGPGKTYSMLKYGLTENIPFIYMKRTIEDVNLICSNNSYGFDASPYVPINRDLKTNVKAKLIDNGIGGFWKYNDEGEPVGLPVAYVLAMSAVKRFKGFDFSRCKIICFDEFIPQLGERVSKKEGELLLDLYMTVSRDKQKRGEEALKLVMFANAEEISTPITNTLEIVDIMADLNATGQRFYYDDERGILLHHITNEEIPLSESEKTGIYAAMKDTAWGAKSFEGYFANNDFTNIKKGTLKHFRPYIHINYKRKDFYVYMDANGNYYCCYSPSKCMFDYFLDKENDQKRFFLEHQAELRDACISDKMKFQRYSMYDLIINYKKFFNVY